MIQISSFLSYHTSAFLTHIATHVGLSGPLILALLCYGDSDHGNNQIKLSAVGQTCRSSRLNCSNRSRQWWNYDGEPKETTSGIASTRVPSSSRSKSFLLLAPFLLAYLLISSRFVTSAKQISAQYTALFPATFFYLVRLLFPHLLPSCRLLFELLRTREYLETLSLDELNAVVESCKQQKKLRKARKALKEATACVSVNYGLSASDPHHGIFLHLFKLCESMCFVHA